MLSKTLATLSQIFGDAASRRESNPSGTDLFASNVNAPAKQHEAYVERGRDGSDLPLVIVPEGGDSDDFFATVATFYPERSPVSSFLHVISKETLPLFQASQLPDFGDSQKDVRPLQKAMIGAAFGETYLYGLSTNSSLSGLSYSACRQSLSFSIARAAGLYGDALRVDDLAKRWTDLRNLSGRPATSTFSTTVVQIYALGANDRYAREDETLDPAVADALASVLSGQTYELIDLRQTLERTYPGLGPMFDELRRSFDGRMSAFTRFVKEIQGNSRGARTDAVAIALACDAIQPGSFAHVGVLGKLTDFFPDALIWYGCLSALSSTSTSGRVDPGIAWKLERDLVEEFSFERRPRCDVSIDEVRILLRASDGRDLFRPANQRLLNVALLPGVDITVRFGTEGEAGERTRRDAEAHQIDDRVVRLLEEALYFANRSVAIRRGGSGITSTRRPRKDR